MESNYFKGFKWALPKSFSDALSKCLFEVGDVIYDTSEAYSVPWDEAKKIIKNSIQIKSIFAINILSDEKNNESSFFENWNSEVVFDLFYYPNMNKKEIKTTQGRLYSFLWKGNDEFIFFKNSFVEKPIMLKSVFKNNDKYQLEILKKSNPNYDFIFYFPVDVSNESYDEKYRKIISSFKRNSDSIKFDIKHYAPEQLNLKYSLSFCPTIEFIVFELSGSQIKINEALKNALYKPSRNKKTDKEYFRLKSHGILVRNN